MKRLILCILLMALTAQSVLAECNPKDIKEKQDGTFSYPVDCHIDYGRLRYSEKEKEKQIEHLKKSIKLKDLAIDFSNERIENWQKATYKLEDRLLKIEKNNENAKWLYFGLGLVVMGGAVWGAGQLAK